MSEKRRSHRKIKDTVDIDMEADEPEKILYADDYPIVPARLQKIINSHGEVPFIKRIGRLIRKHTRIHYKRKSGIISVVVAGVEIITIDLKEL